MRQGESDDADLSPSEVPAREIMEKDSSQSCGWLNGPTYWMSTQALVTWVLLKAAY